MQLESASGMIPQLVGASTIPLACSSAVEQATVNRPVVGSIPTTPAILLIALLLGGCELREPNEDDLYFIEKDGVECVVFKMKRRGDWFAYGGISCNWPEDD